MPKFIYLNDNNKNNQNVSCCCSCDWNFKTGTLRRSLTRFKPTNSSSIDSFSVAFQFGYILSVIVRMLFCFVRVLYYDIV